MFAALPCLPGGFNTCLQIEFLALEQEPFVVRCRMPWDTRRVKVFLPLLLMQLNSPVSSFSQQLEANCRCIRRGWHASAHSEMQGYRGSGCTSQRIETTCTLTMMRTPDVARTLLSVRVDVLCRTAPPSVFWFWVGRHTL